MNTCIILLLATVVVMLGVTSTTGIECWSCTYSSRRDGSITNGSVDCRDNPDKTEKITCGDGSSQYCQKLEGNGTSISKDKYEFIIRGCVENKSNKTKCGVEVLAAYNFNNTKEGEYKGNACYCNKDLCNSATSTDVFTLLTILGVVSTSYMVL